mgnify:FL=1
MNGPPPIPFPPGARTPPALPPGPAIAYVLPTRNRPTILAATIAHLSGLPRHPGGAQVIIVDNASDVPATTQIGRATELPNGLTIEVVRSETNLGAAGRNLGVIVSDPSCRWIVMLDDDSWPTDLGFLDAIQRAEQPAAKPAATLADRAEPVGAIAGDIQLSSGDREAGGLPEVFTGCGAIIRRDAFLSAGGYDASFGYYAEEYDLAARLILMGLRIETDLAARFEHAKVGAGRDMDLILARLVRNNAWVAQRYAPVGLRRDEIRRTVERYRAIAAKERAQDGFDRGLRETLHTLRRQARRSMNPRQWDRFTGKSAARRGLLAAFSGQTPAARGQSVRGFARASVVPGGRAGDGGTKNQHLIVEALSDIGVEIVAPGSGEDVRVVGTLSPGPMLDALDGAGSFMTPTIGAWRPVDSRRAPADIQIAPDRAASKATGLTARR